MSDGTQNQVCRISVILFITWRLTRFKSNLDDCQRHSGSSYSSPVQVIHFSLYMKFTGHETVSGFASFLFFFFYWILRITFTRNEPPGAHRCSTVRAYPSPHRPRPIQPKGGPWVNTCIQCSASDSDRIPRPPALPESPPGPYTGRLRPRGGEDRPGRPAGSRSARRVDARARRWLFGPDDAWLTARRTYRRKRGGERKRRGHIGVSDPCYQSTPGTSRPVRRHTRDRPRMGCVPCVPLTANNEDGRHGSPRCPSSRRGRADPCRGDTVHRGRDEGTL